MARGLLTLGFLLAAGSVWAEAGRVMYVSGEAALIRGGNLPIIKGMPVEAGDTITTGADGRVQLLMADGDRIALRPNSRFSIDEFSGPSRSKPGEPVVGTRPSNWKSFYTLAKGGFRTLTQSLGQRDAASYQVRTPVATIGIRGTDYTLLYCPEGCEVYQTAGSGVRVEGMQASVFRESAGSRLLFAALGMNWVQEFLKAQQQDSGGGSSELGKLIGGVSKGGIEVTDPNGNVNEVKDNEFFQADTTGGFEKLPDAPEGLNDSSESDGEGNYEAQVGDSSSDEDLAEGGDSQDADDTGGGSITDASGEPPTQDIGSSGGDLTGGGTPAVPDPLAPPSTLPPRDGLLHSAAIGTGPLEIVGGGVFERDSSVVVASDNSRDLQLGFDGDGRLTGLGYENESGFVDALFLGRNGSNVNDGFDIDYGPGGENAETGLRWGRWVGEAEVWQLSESGNTQVATIDLSQTSLHWIYGPADENPPVLPMTGSASYALIGNTNPTDNHGNVGVLGHADFAVDFTSGGGDITTSLGLNINSQTWQADGFCENCIGLNGTFFGQYDNVTITDDESCGDGCGGYGDFAGFFTPGGSSIEVPYGAGMAYSLNNGDEGPGNATVSGVAAFGDPSMTGPPSCDGEC